MKKLLFFAFGLILLLFLYILYDEYSFVPLDESDVGKLFKGDHGHPDKICSKDSLGLSFHGELFDIYKLDVGKVLIDESFPMVDEWANKPVDRETIVGRWKHCPMDSQALKLYKPILTLNDFSNIDCFESFDEVLRDPENYYSYIYFEELESYFLLYCLGEEVLYYVRHKGF